MGYRVSLVDQKVCAGTTVRSCVIVDGYIHTVGDRIERFKIDEVTNTLGNGEVLGANLPSTGIGTCYDGEHVNIKLNNSSNVVRYNPAIYSGYTTHGSILSFLVGLVKTQDGDFHAFFYGSSVYGLRTYRFGNDTFNHINTLSLAYIADIVTSGNYLIVAASSGVYIYEWDGTVLSEIYKYTESSFSPRAVVVYGNTILAFDSNNKLKIFETNWNTLTTSLVKSINSFNGLYSPVFDGSSLAGMAENAGVKIYTVHDNTPALVDAVAMPNLTLSDATGRTQLDRNHKYVAAVDGSNVYLFKRVLIAQAEFPNGTSGTAPFHLTARAI